MENEIQKENDSDYSIEQESVIEGWYADFFYALSQRNFEAAEQIVKLAEAKEFWKVANDMKSLLAQKKLHE